MSLTLSFDSQPIISNHEVVTLTSPEEEVFSITNAVRHPIATEEISRSRGVYLVTDIVWTIPRFVDSSSVARDIRPGWLLTDSSSNEFTVISNAAYSDIGKFHRFVARNFILAENLQDFVEVMRISTIQDPAGRSIPIETSIALSVPSRIQGMDQDIVTRLGVEQLGKNFDVYMARDVGLKIKDQIRVHGRSPYMQDVAPTPGTILEIVGVANRQTITDLITAHCVDNGARFTHIQTY